MENPSDVREVKALNFFKPNSEQFVRLCVTCVFAIAAIVLLGWEFDIDLFKCIIPGYITMKTNTAIGLSLLAFTNYLNRSESFKANQNNTWTLVPSLVALVIGVATLIEYRFDLNLGIDEFLFVDGSGRTGLFPPGRLAPITAFLMIVMSSAQFLNFNRIKTFPRFAQLLGFLSLVIAFQAFISYIFGVKNAFGFAFYTQMALHTTVLVSLVSLSFLGAKTKDGFMRMLLSESAGAQLAKNLLIWAVAVPPLMRWLQNYFESTGFLSPDFSPVFLVTGNTLFFVVLILRNAVVMHAADIKKRESDEQYKLVTQLSPQILWTASKDGVFDYYNQRWFDYTGMNASDTEQFGWIKAMHKDDQMRYLNRWDFSISSGTPFEVEVRLLRAGDSQYRWHLCRAVATRDLQGQIIKWFGTATDIHDQKKTENELLNLAVEKHAAKAIEKNEARLRAIVNSAFDAIIGIDQQGRVTDWNVQAEKIFGHTSFDIVGYSLIQKIIPPEDQHHFEYGLKMYIQTGASHLVHRTIEIEALKKDGTRFPIQFSITSILTNNVYSFIAFISDITKRKQNEFDLIAARQNALDAAHAKSMFFANMSHEIRTPLNGIIGMTDLLIETPLDAKQHKYASIVQSSGSHLLKIINDILDFSKMDAGKLHLELLDFNPVTLMESQIELLGVKAREKGLKLNMICDSQLPINLKGDSGRISQIILNLISNAIKFTARGSIDVTANVIHRTSKTTVIEFGVRDTGIGLSPEAARRLFQPFVQADETTARKFGGTGLGLSICKQLVELMKGEIFLETAEGQGSYFRFRIPLEMGQAQLTLTPTLPFNLPEKSELTKFRILVAEDNSVNQLLTLAQLKKLGFQAHAVANGREVLEALSGAEYHLVLMDCQMPEMDGFEATRLIRKKEKEHSLTPLPIIALTANATGRDREMCLNAGMNNFISKPTKKDVLAEVILGYLNLLKAS